MKVVNGIINRIYEYAVSIVGILVLGVVFAMSLICTCFKTSDSNEQTFFCQDSVIQNIIFILIFLAVLVFVKRNVLWQRFSDYLIDDINYKKIKRVLLMGMLFVCCGWVLITQYLPGSDQLDVVNCAYKLHAGEYNMLDPGGYLDKWTNQIGLAFIDYFLARIWGDFNIVAFQILNAFGLTILYKKIADILEDLNVSKSIVVMSLVSGLLFFPLIMYTTFVYGTIWHLTLALIAFSQEQRYFEDYKWWRIPLCAFSVAFAVQVKNNALIYVVALVIYALIGLFNDTAAIVKKVSLIICMCLVTVVFAKIPPYVIEKHTGYKMDQGVSSYAFIAMGLQGGEFAPGWWNGYNNQSYEACGYNTEAQTVMAKAEIKERVNVMLADKPYAFRFFSRKLASMWTDPTFQCFWINQLRYHRVILPGWIEKLMSAKGYTLVAKISDYFQSLVYLGAALWIILENKIDKNKRSFFLMAFLGGFIFHVFWEAKTQYSITYMVLLLPCAIMGFGLFADRINSVIAKETVKYLARGRFYLAIFIATVLAYFMTYISVGEECLTEDTISYAEYVENWEAPDLNESVLEINIMKTEIKDHKDFIIYLERLLNDNQIGY